MLILFALLTTRLRDRKALRENRFADWSVWAEIFMITTAYYSDKRQYGTENANLLTGNDFTARFSNGPTKLFHLRISLVFQRQVCENTRDVVVHSAAGMSKSVHIQSVFAYRRALSALVRDTCARVRRHAIRGVRVRKRKTS